VDFLTNAISVQDKKCVVGADLDDQSARKRGSEELADGQSETTGLRVLVCLPADGTSLAAAALSVPSTIAAATLQVAAAASSKCSFSSQLSVFLFVLFVASSLYY
jgi:hypothetical protein